MKKIRNTLAPLLAFGYFIFMLTPGALATNVFPLNGNVGIATTNPQNPLDVNGIVGTTWGVGFNTYFSTNGWTNTGSGYAGALQFLPDTGAYYFWNSSKAGAGVLNALGNPTMVMTQAGQVGIGTSTPTAYLNVQPASPVGQALLNVDNLANAASSNNTAFIHSDQPFLSGNNSGTYSGSVMEITAFPNTNVNANSGDILKLGVSDSSGNAFASYLEVKAATGNVGIGTANPAYLLDVRGSANNMLQIQSSTPTLGYLDLRNASTASSSGMDLRLITTAAAGGGSAVVDMVKYATGGFTISNGETGVNGYTSFGVGSSERMRITSSGKIGIANSNPQYTLDVAGTANVSAGVTSSVFTLTSDQRLKEEIEPLDQQLDKVMQIKPVQFYWNNVARQRGITDSGRQVGFVAQDVESVYPELVKTAADGFKSVNYSGLVSPLMQAVKEFYGKWQNENSRLENKIAVQRTEIEKRDEKIRVLENRIDRIEARLANATRKSN